MRSDNVIDLSEALTLEAIREGTDTEDEDELSDVAAPEDEQADAEVLVEESDDIDREREVDEPAALPIRPLGLTLHNLEPMEELLQILLLSRRGAYARIFDFRELLAERPRLKYLTVDEQGNQAVSTAELSTWIRETAASSGLDSPDQLFDALDTQYVVTDAEALQERLARDWNKLSSRIRAVLRLEDYLRNTRLGYIEVSAPTAADEMKIFELINTGGTPLTSAEILSAKRDWNLEVANAPQPVRESRIRLYAQALRIPPRDEVVRRWDIAATLLDRLDLAWIFGEFNIRKKPQFEAQTILGFQLYAGRYLGKLMKDDLGDLASNNEISWETLSLDTEIRGSISAASSVPLAYWQQWSRRGLSLRSSMSAAVALEFVLLLVSDWRRKEQPSSGARREALQRNAVVTIDRLVFEYLTRRWAGSSDSKIAGDLRQFADGPDVVSPVPESDWSDLIEQALLGEDRFSPPPTRQGKTPVRKEMRLLLLYFYMLRGIEAPTEAEGGFAIDHIIPEAKFEASHSSQELRNRITNLAIVPALFNQRKSNHSMDALPATFAGWLKSKIDQYEQIDEARLLSYTSAEDVEALHEYRAGILRETFRDHRTHFLRYLTPRASMVA
jgi:hypothetical protein